MVSFIKKGCLDVLNGDYVSICLSLMMRIAIAVIPPDLNANPPKNSPLPCPALALGRLTPCGLNGSGFA